jgi:hypothetical protein
MRPICEICKQRPRAVAYHRYDKIYYRSRCTMCIRKELRSKVPIPRWQSSDYKKKPMCDRCGFRAKYAAQLLVYHVDGNMNNVAVRNLKTVCQNCVIEVAKSTLAWRPGDLEPDL